MRDLFAALIAFALCGEAFAACEKQSHSPVDVVPLFVRISVSAIDTSTNAARALTFQSLPAQRATKVFFNFVFLHRINLEILDSEAMHESWWEL